MSIMKSKMYQVLCCNTGLLCRNIININHLKKKFKVCIIERRGPILLVYYLNPLFETLTVKFDSLIGNLTLAATHNPTQVF